MDSGREGPGLSVVRATRNRRKLIVVATSVALATIASAGLALAPGDPAPFLTGSDLAGEITTVRWKSSSATIVNFWATWCEPCREEMPALQELYGRRADDGLAIVGVHLLGSSKNEISTFVEQTGARYPILLGDVSIARQWTVGLLPTSFLIDDKGVVVRRYVGATPEQIAGLVADAEAWLDKRPLGTISTPDESAVTVP
jgi:thiol-disulfide isomerase/thioredoxin